MNTQWRLLSPALLPTQAIPLTRWVIVDAEGRPVLLDHGDSFPRAIKLTRFSNRAMLNGQLKNGAVFEFEKFPGEG